MKWCLMPDTDLMKHTTVSFGFNIEVTDSSCRYVRLLYLDTTLRTMTSSYWFSVRLCFRWLKNSDHSFLPKIPIPTHVFAGYSIASRSAIPTPNPALDSALGSVNGNIVDSAIQTHT